MTNNEATKMLRTIKRTVYLGNRKFEDALDVAISALGKDTNVPSNNLIDRQAAIDALERVASFFPYKIPGKGETYDKYNEAWSDAIGRAEMEIERLPSAQPAYTDEQIQKMQDMEQAQLDKAFELGREDAKAEIVRCCKCGFWDRDTLRHQFNDFRDWNEAECKILAERDPYHEIDRCTEADDFCSRAERRTDDLQ